MTFAHRQAWELFISSLLPHRQLGEGSVGKIRGDEAHLHPQDTPGSLPCHEVPRSQAQLQCGQTLDSRPQEPQYGHCTWSRDLAEQEKDVY